MLSFLRVDRSVVTDHVQHCAQRRKMVSQCKRTLHAEVLSELSRPGCIGAAFVLGALSGSSPVRIDAKDLAQHQEKTEDLLAAILADMPHEAPVPERGSEEQGSARASDAGRNSDTLKDALTATVVRVVASLAIKRLSELEIFAETP